MHKTVRVETNDKTKSVISLAVEGQVEKFVDINPSPVRFLGPVGHELKKTVKIQLEKKYPFKILEVKLDKGQYIKYTLETEKGQYLLHLENLRKDPGRYFDVITLKTDNKIMPELKIRVFGNILWNKHGRPTGKKKAPSVKSSG